MYKLKSIYIYICMYVYIYTYTCCKSQNLVQKWLLGGFKAWSKFYLFFWFSKIFFLLQGKWELSKKLKKMTNIAIFGVETWSNYVAQRTWTKFWPNLGFKFWLNLFDILGPFSKDVEPPSHFYSVFWQELIFLSSPPQIKEHYLSTQLR